MIRKKPLCLPHWLPRTRGASPELVPCEPPLAGCTPLQAYVDGAFLKPKYSSRHTLLCTSLALFKIVKRAGHPKTMGNDEHRVHRAA